MRFFKEISTSLESFSRAFTSVFEHHQKDKDGNTIHHEDEKGRGGISGSPLFKLSTEKLIEARKLIGSDLPIIASGGVMNAQDFYEKITSGADLVQIYSGFIFEGPKLVKDVLNKN